MREKFVQVIERIQATFVHQGFIIDSIKKYILSLEKHWACVNSKKAIRQFRHYSISQKHEHCQTQRANNFRFLIVSNQLRQILKSWHESTQFRESKSNLRVPAKLRRIGINPSWLFQPNCSDFSPNPLSSVKNQQKIISVLRKARFRMLHKFFYKLYYYSCYASAELRNGSPPIPNAHSSLPFKISDLDNWKHRAQKETPQKESSHKNSKELVKKSPESSQSPSSSTIPHYISDPHTSISAAPVIAIYSAQLVNSITPQERNTRSRPQSPKVNDALGQKIFPAKNALNRYSRTKNSAQNTKGRTMPWEMKMNSPRLPAFNMSLPTNVWYKL